MSALRPLMLQERRQSGHCKASRSCEELTRSASFDRLVGAEQERLRDGQAHCFRRLEIDHKLELGRLLIHSAWLLRVTLLTSSVIQSCAAFVPASLLVAVAGGWNVVRNSDANEPR